jgi:hypothetical protein
MTRPTLRPPRGFQAATVEKVERLLELLEVIRVDRSIGDRFVLHGGTALDVFHLDLPRLSIDIDLSYVGSADREVMLSERGGVLAALEALVGRLGYTASPGSQEHAGVSYKLAYATGRGQELLKIDANFLSRVPLLGHSVRTCSWSDPAAVFATLELDELLAGKVKALLERKRLAVRDLYDLAVVVPTLELTPRFKALIVHYWSISRAFPCDLVGRVRGRLPTGDVATLELETALYPVLALEDRPTVEGMAAPVLEFLEGAGALSPEQAEYLRLLDEESIYRPEMLFAEWPAVLERARVSPAAAWKVENLAKRPRS